MSTRGAPLKSAWEEATPLVECALMLRGEGRPHTSYASEIASVTQWEIICFDAASPWRPAPKHTKSWLDFLQPPVRSTCNFNARTGKSKLSFLSSSETKEGGWKDWRLITWEGNAVDNTLGTYPGLGLKVTRTRSEVYTCLTNRKSLKISHPLQWSQSN